MSQVFGKSRSTLDIDASATNFFRINGSAAINPNTTRVRKIGFESVSTARHGWPGNKGKVRDIGGSFVSYKLHWTGGTHVSLGSPKSGSITYHLDGTVFPIAPNVASPPSLPMASTNEMIGIGTKGFNRAAPTKPLSDAAEFVGEMRQLPSADLGVLLNGVKALRGGPKVPKFPKMGPNFGPDIQHMIDKADQFRRFARRSGSAYLNAEFGWLPFVRGIQDMLEVHAEHAKHAQRFVRDNGRVVRRRVSLDSTTVTNRTVSASGSYPSPSGVAYLWTGTGKIITHDITTTRSWFSGAFTYFIPGMKPLPDGTIKDNEAIRAKLYGLRITPELLWNLSPWTWLIDYGGNMGDILSNLSRLSNDNLICLYGYAMHHSIATRTYSLDCPTHGGSVHTSLTARIEIKQRAKGNPYGFSANFEPTGSQSAILAALGASRL